MGLRTNLILTSFMLLLAVSAKAQSGEIVYDVTKYGAKPNTDIAQALANTWKDACASTHPSKVLIPAGMYGLSGAKLSGPCKSPIEVEALGTLQAPKDLKGDNWVTFAYVNRLTVLGNGVFDGQGQQAWDENDCNTNIHCDKHPMNLKFNFITHSTVKDITSLNSKNFHIFALGCTNLTFQHVTITAPENSLNTDGIHIGRSVGVNIINTNIKTGDDCVSLGDGSKQITITDLTCGPGHGVSIGSLGRYNGEQPVEGVYVKQCKFISTSNGVRIKSWPASPAPSVASDMHFEDIEMNNVSNPILIDQEYCPWNQCNREVPSKVQISKVSFKNIRGSSSTPVALKLICSASNPCKEVVVTDINLSYNGNAGPIISQCKNVNPIISGIQKPRACSSPTPVAAPSTP